jgi:hypothetical protein
MDYARKGVLYHSVFEGYGGRDSGQWVRIPGTHRSLRSIAMGLTKA